MKNGEEYQERISDEGHDVAEGRERERHGCGTRVTTGGLIAAKRSDLGRVV